VLCASLFTPSYRREVEQMRWKISPFKLTSWTYNDCSLCTGKPAFLSHPRRQPIAFFVSASGLTWSKVQPTPARYSRRLFHPSFRRSRGQRSGSPFPWTRVPMAGRAAGLDGGPATVAGLACRPPSTRHSMQPEMRIWPHVIPVVSGRQIGILRGLCLQGDPHDIHARRPPPPLRLAYIVANTRALSTLYIWKVESPTFFSHVFCHQAERKITEKMTSLPQQNGL